MNKMNKKASSLVSLILLYTVLFIALFGIIQYSIAKQYLHFENVNPEIKQSLTSSEESRARDTKKENQKINVLLTGIGGGNHDAPNLTDTIILASFNTEKDTISMLSIPRDLYVKHPDEDDNRTGKINWVYVSSFNKGKDAAMHDLAKKVTEITGERVDYYASVNFNGLKEIVDILGGIEIDVPEAIVDYEYPTYNHGYTTFSIGEGFQTLDGETALRYARSRHSTSDFSRSMRQQEIIKAIKAKAEKLGYLKDANKIKQVYDSVNDNLRTDMPLKEIIKLALIMQKNPGTILSTQFNDSCYYQSPTCMSGGLVYTPLRSEFGGASVFLVNGNTKYSLSNYERTLPYGDIVFNFPLIAIESAEIEIYNETGVGGIAGALSVLLTQYNFNAEAIGGSLDLDSYLPPSPQEEGENNTIESDEQNVLPDGIREVELEEIRENTIYYDQALTESDTLAALKKYLDFTFTPATQLDNTNKIVIQLQKNIGIPDEFLVAVED